MPAIQNRKRDIISGGGTISSLEREDTLHGHPEILEVAVILVPSDEWGESPKACVVPESGDASEPGITDSGAGGVHA